MVSKGRGPIVILIENHLLLKNRAKTTNLPPTRVDTSAKRLCNGQVENALLLCRGHHLLAVLITPQTVRVRAHNCNAIEKLQYPSAQKDLWSLLRLSTGSWWGEPSISIIEALSKRKICKDHPNRSFMLATEGKNSVDDLKRTLMSTPALEYPRATSYYAADRNAYNTEVEWLLYRKQTDKSDRPIWYWHRALNDGETNLERTNSALPYYRPRYYSDRTWK